MSFLSRLPNFSKDYIVFVCFTSNFICSMVSFVAKVSNRVHVVFSTTGPRHVHSLLLYMFSGKFDQLSGFTFLSDSFFIKVSFPYSSSCFASF